MTINNKLTRVDEYDSFYFIPLQKMGAISSALPRKGKNLRMLSFFRRVCSNMLTEINMLRHCVLVHCFPSTLPRHIEK